MSNQTNQNISQEFSKSMDQLCYQLSYANVNITPLKDAANIYDFIAGFELATAGLSEEQRVPLLAKGFPPGRYRHWYENNLQPLINSKGSWQEAKAKLIERFTEPKDRDRHFMKLKKLQYDPDGKESLTEFVDEVTYAYEKAIGSRSVGGREDDTLLIQHVKASLPQSVVTTLSVYSDYRDAKTIGELYKAIREYDSLRGSSPKNNNSDKSSMAEFTSMFQQLISGMKQEQEATRNTIVAAIKEDRQYRTISKEQSYRDRSPIRSEDRNQPMQNNRDNYRYSNQPMQSKSPTYPRRDSGRRSPYGSPRPRRPNEPTNHPPNDRKGFNRPAFNSETYYERFGMPSSPCEVCGDMHHVRHCPVTLN